MTRRFLLFGFGILLFLIGVFLPFGADSADSSAVGGRGVALLRLGFEIEGLLLLALSLTGLRWRSASRENLLELPPPEGKDVQHPLLWLSAVTALAAALRFYRIGSDLWLDEITTVLPFRGVSPFSIIAAYGSPNNHLLNTLLVQAMVAAFGPTEWAIRLPAVLFGIACIPAIYALARVALGQREALCAALLLAVSYHHIFFSQNARGYTQLLFWSMLGTTAFLRGLARDRARDWILYVVSMFLAIATVLHGVLIVAGHLASFAVACALRRRQRKSVWPLADRLAVVLAGLGLLCLHLYAGVLAQGKSYFAAMATRYNMAAIGYAPFSAEHARELVRGFSAGFGNAAIPGALAALLVMGFGFLLFLRRHALYAITLTAPLVAAAAFLLARHYNFAPRYFLWGVPVAWIFAVGTATSLQDWLRSRSSVRTAAGQTIARLVPFLIIGLLVALSAASLPAYYGVPKQATRTSLDWVLRQRRADDPVVATPTARPGLRFYGPPMGLAEGKSFFVVETAAELQNLEKASGPRTVWLLTTFRRALALERPDLDSYIREHYRERRTFPGTIGEGEITILTRVLVP